MQQEGSCCPRMLRSHHRRFSPPRTSVPLRLLAAPHGLRKLACPCTRLSGESYKYSFFYERKRRLRELRSRILSKLIFLQQLRARLRGQLSCCDTENVVKTQIFRKIDANEVSKVALGVRWRNSWKRSRSQAACGKNRSRVMLDLIMVDGDVCTVANFP